MTGGRSNIRSKDNQQTCLKALQLDKLVYRTGRSNLQKLGTADASPTQAVEQLNLQVLGFALCKGPRCCNHLVARCHWDLATQPCITTLYVAISGTVDCSSIAFKLDSTSTTDLGINERL
eukprot:1231241-Amphidinium_carterae.1